MIKEKLAFSLVAIFATSSLLLGGDMGVKTNSNVVEIITEEEKTWSFDFEPYMMAININGDAGLWRASGIPLDINFGDILERLQMGVMIHFEAHHKSGWGLWLDYVFMDLKQDIGGPFGSVLTANVRQGGLEAFGIYRQEYALGQLDYIAGIRWWNNTIGATLDSALLPGSPTLKVEKDWADLVVGVRWTQPISQNWKVRLRGDIGGLGLSSKFTAATSIGFFYTINDLMDLDLRYKATWVNHEEGTLGARDYFRYDTVTHGPIVGIKFKF